MQARQILKRDKRGGKISCKMIVLERVLGLKRMQCQYFTSHLRSYCSCCFYSWLVYAILVVFMLLEALSPALSKLANSISCFWNSICYFSMFASSLGKQFMTFPTSMIKMRLIIYGNTCCVVLETKNWEEEISVLLSNTYTYNIAPPRFQTYIYKARICHLEPLTCLQIYHSTQHTLTAY
jgi:hypothetical protein